MISAVLVGVESYEAGPSWDLNGPVRDVRRVLDHVLKCGIPAAAVRCYTAALPANEHLNAEMAALGVAPGKPTERNLSALFDDELRREAGRSIFLYWSGHGFMQKDGHRRLFVCDATPTTKLNVNLNNLIEALDSSYFPQVQSVDAVVDACANYIAATQQGIVDRSYTISQRSVGKQIRVLCAAAAGEYATNIRAERTGVFTRELMTIAESSAMRPNEIFDFERTASCLREKFRALRASGQVRQTPNLIWARGQDREITDELPAVNEGDLFLSRLGVFEGSFTFLGCRAVYPRSRSLEVEAQVDRLRTAGLVVRHDTIPRRYLLSSMARPVAKGRLRELGEEELTRDNHARFYASLTIKHEPLLRSAAREASLGLLEQEHDNIIAALNWCSCQPQLRDLGLSMTASLFWFWNLTGRFQAGVDWLGRFLRYSQQVDGHIQANGQYASGALAFMMGDYVTATEMLDRARGYWRQQAQSKERSIRLAYILVVLGRARGSSEGAERDTIEAFELFESTGDAWGQALALNDRGYIQALFGDLSGSLASLEASASKWRTIGDNWGTALALNNLGMVYLLCEETDRARARHDEALQLQLDAGDAWGAAESLKYLGETALHADDLAEAEECFRTSLLRLKDADRPQIRIDCLIGLARLQAHGAALSEEAARRAARLYGVWLRETGARTMVRPPKQDEIANKLKRRLQLRLGDTFALERSKGSEMPLDEALSLRRL